MIYENFKNLATDRTIKAVIGMSREKFDSLVPYFSSAYDKIQQERYENKEIKRISTNGKKGVFSNHEERLFFVLYYLKTYPTFDVLGFLFGLSAGHAHDYVEFFMRVLKRALSDMDMLPKETIGTPNELSQLVDKYKDIIIDGVETPCVRPHDEERQKECYSGKKTPYREISSYF
jgi:hypothetical protein